mmetsp:Transcript_33520/g.48616  ORF Transcript_33520/g.48616 Transcript_33520/m.48616 type:complete len:347 (+) Transcript_33520:28-1068(+)
MMVEEIKLKIDTFLQGLREDFDGAVTTLITEKEILKNEIVELKKRKVEISEDVKNMEGKMVFKSPVILNIGGVLYTTSVNTLTNVKGSMLESMFSGRHKLTADERDGSFFIDRDGVPFRYILNYLRDPTHFVPPADNELKKEIAREAKYYSLTQLVEILTGGEIIFLDGSSSSILDSAMKETLVKMFDSNKGHLNLKLLCTSAQGIGVAVFDNATKGKGRILTLIKSNANHVFGCFIEDIFGQQGAWIPGSTENFLFALGNFTGSPAKLFNSGNGNSIHITSCGLHAGQSGDLVAFCSHSCAAPTTYTRWAPGYTPVTLSAGFLCGTPGNPTYTPLIMEVFQVSFT